MSSLADNQWLSFTTQEQMFLLLSQLGSVVNEIHEYIKKKKKSLMTSKLTIVDLATDPRRLNKIIWDLGTDLQNNIEILELISKIII